MLQRRDMKTRWLSSDPFSPQPYTIDRLHSILHPKISLATTKSNSRDFEMQLSRCEPDYCADHETFGRVARQDGVRVSMLRSTRPHSAHPPSWSGL